jgi:hypothetical protein
MAKIGETVFGVNSDKFMVWGSDLKSAASGPLTINFQATVAKFKTVPLVTMSYQTLGRSEGATNTGDRPSITALSTTSFTMYSGNGASDFYINWIAVGDKL